MSGYNDLFNFNTCIGAHDMQGALNAEPAPTMDKSGTWITAPSASSGLIEGGTAAQLHARLDLAPSKGARSSGALMLASPSASASVSLTQSDPATPTKHSEVDSGAKHACAECLSPFRTDSALHQHAKATEHQAYKCACGTGFSKHSALKRHIDTKDAPKTFACTLCDDSFIRKDKLKDHCRLYHKVKGEWLQALFNSQQARPCAAGAPRRRRAPVPLAAASSRSASTLAAAFPPVLAPDSAEAPLWSLADSTGQRYANFPTGLLATTSPFVAASSFNSAAGLAPAALAPSEDILGLAGDFFGDETWATGFDGFNF